MTLNFLSKYGLVIGTASIAISLATLYENPGILDVGKFKGLDDNIWGIMLAGIVSCLLILGIIKKCCWLIAPSLVTGILGSIYVTSTYMSKALETSDFDDYMIIAMQIGVEVIILYPIYNLFADLRREKATVLPKGLPANCRDVIQATSMVNVQTRLI